MNLDDGWVPPIRHLSLPGSPGGANDVDIADPQPTTAAELSYPALVLFSMKLSQIANTSGSSGVSSTNRRSASISRWVNRSAGMGWPNRNLRRVAAQIVLNISLLGGSALGFIVVCQMKFRRAVARGEAHAVLFRMQGAPVTSWLTSLFLEGVLVMMAFDYPNGTLTVASLPVVALFLVGGWYLLRRPKAVMMTPTMPSVNLTRKFLE